MADNVAKSSSAACPEVVSRWYFQSRRFSKAERQGGVFQTVTSLAAPPAPRRPSGRHPESAKIIEAIRQVVRAKAEESSRMTVEETLMGRVDHKIRKHYAAADLTPGVEDLEAVSWTGDHGLTVVEMAPYGVIGAVTPSTHPVPTMVNNSISIIAAGNAVVFNVHPAGKKVSAWAVRHLNEAITRAGGPANLISMVENPTLESAQHSSPIRIRVLLATGGLVARPPWPAQRESSPAGQSPVVVDETADIDRRPRYHRWAFDNNILYRRSRSLSSIGGRRTQARLVRHSGTN